MNAFDVAAILVAAAAVFGYVNHRFLRLPSTSGTLLVALVSSLVVVLIDRVVPGFDLRSAMEGVLTWFTFGLIGVDVSLLVCLTFGALISPTDPIAVMGLLKAYAVVVFSVLVQGLTVRRVLMHYGVGERTP